MKISEIKDGVSELNDELQGDFQLTDEQKQIWQKFEETGVLDGWGDKKVDIRKNYQNYKGKRILIKNCSNLKKIKGDCSGFIELNISSCSQLEKVSCYYNSIKRLIFFDNSNLKTIYLPYGKITRIFADNIAKNNNLTHLDVSNNKLNNLDLRKLVNLKILNCSNNHGIFDLNVNNLKFLEKLICNNCGLIELDCSFLENLTELLCQDNRREFFNPVNGSLVCFLFFKKLVLEGCFSLKVLDCGENQLQEITLDNHRELIQVSFKSNDLNRLIIKNARNLKLLEFSDQGKNCLDKEKGKFYCEKETPTEFFIDRISRANIEIINYNKKTKFIDFDDKKEVTLNDFPKLDENTFREGNSEETPYFEEAYDKLQAEEEQAEQRKLREANSLPEDEGYNSESDQKKKNDEIPLCSWVLPTPKVGVKKIDLPHKGLTGKLIIADYPNLTFINVGNNDLEALIIRNCPKLTRLIYAHNNLREPEADISDCDNLRMENIYNNKCQGGWERPDLTEDEKNQLNQEREQEEESEEKDQTKLLAQIIRLIGQAEEALQNKNYQKLVRLVEQIKKLAEQEIQGLNKAELQAKMNKFKQALLIRENNTTSKNHWPWVFGSILLIPTILSIFVLLVRMSRKKGDKNKNLC